MIKRTIDISEAAHVKLRHSQLVIERDGVSVAAIPVEDIGTLILQHPAIVLTQAAMVACQQHNVAVLFCDAKHLPYSVLLPIAEGHSLHSKILKIQTETKAVRKKQLWQSIVQHKITQQAVTLEYCNKPHRRLLHLAKQVKSGDKENHEAQAAKYYWQTLMGNRFRRDPDGDGINALLNYGYAVVRAMTARAIVGGGLHPALGLYHQNQYNALCLADDLMEPFRPWVDHIVFGMSAENSAIQITREHKAPLLKLLATPVSWRDKAMPWMVSMHYFIADLKAAYSSATTVTLHYPQWHER